MVIKPVGGRIKAFDLAVKGIKRFGIAHIGVRAHYRITAYEIKLFFKVIQVFCISVGNFAFVAVNIGKINPAVFRKDGAVFNIHRITAVKDAVAEIIADSTVIGSISAGKKR